MFSVPFLTIYCSYMFCTVSRSVLLARSLCFSRSCTRCRARLRASPSARPATNPLNALIECAQHVLLETPPSNPASWGEGTLHRAPATSNGEGRGAHNATSVGAAILARTCLAKASPPPRAGVQCPRPTEINEPGSAHQTSLWCAISRTRASAQR